MLTSICMFMLISGEMCIHVDIIWVVSSIYVIVISMCVCDGVDGVMW